jgi:hypothetical protein
MSCEQFLLRSRLRNLASNVARLFVAMPCSAVQVARRELVKLLMALASAYSVVLALTREATDAQVSSAFRRVIKAVHRDKGGKVEDAQRLIDAKDKWDAAKGTAQKGRPRSDRSDWLGAMAPFLGTCPGPFQEVVAQALVCDSRRQRSRNDACASHATGHSEN